MVGDGDVRYDAVGLIGGRFSSLVIFKFCRWLKVKVSAFSRKDNPILQG